MDMKALPKGLATYRIHEKSYISDPHGFEETGYLAGISAGKLCEAGEEIRVSTKIMPGPHWEPLDQLAKDTIAYFKANPIPPRAVSEQSLVHITQAPGH